MKVYSLNAHSVRRFVPKRVVGFYRLGRSEGGKFSRQYFGRSDRDLRTRLIQHARTGKHTHFQFAVTRTILNAFNMECGEWHLPRNALENRIHPDAPSGIAYRCRYCRELDLPDSLENLPFSRTTRATPVIA